MAEYITLLGAGDVRSAGSTIREAATVMRGAAASIDDSLSRHRTFLDDWLFRLEEIMKGGDKNESSNH